MGNRSTEKAQPNQTLNLAPIFKEERGLLAKLITNGQGFSELWLCNKVSIKCKPTGFRELLNTWRFLEVIHSERTLKLCTSFPRPCPVSCSPASDVITFTADQKTNTLTKTDKTEKQHRNSGSMI